MSKKLFLFFFLFILIVLISLSYFVRAISSPANPKWQGKIFSIKEGQGVNEISSNLYQEDLIKNKLIFETYIWLKNLEGRLQAGEHHLNSGLSIKDLTKILTQAVVEERIIRIIEGWRSEEIGKYLAEEGAADEENFLRAVFAPQFTSSDYPFFADKPPSASLEGYLFPDTYRIYKDSREEEIIKKMLDNFGLKLDENLREEIKSQNRSVFEVITLASIVEKEVSSREDRALVADIFLKRLAVEMPLQSDATVNYVTKKGVIQPSYEDLKVESRYNTYKYTGLPPGPISNPGREAILAVIYPQKNDYWYFLTTPEGKTIFSETGEEHLKNKAKYLK